jgi:hypothetical protein
MDDLRGRWSLVTGASSGLGVDFARELAARGSNLVLVARREERLQVVAAELRQRHRVEAEALAADLAAPGAPQQLFDHLQQAGRQVDVLVNNAGLGLYGPFLEIPWQREAGMLQLDVVALVHLTRLFVPGMRQRGFGRVLQVSSVGAFQPTPLYASYSAAKAFVLSYGEALNFELRGTGVSCTVVAPGITATEFLQVSGQTATLYQRLMLMTSAEVARVGVRALLRGRGSVVPGLANKLGAFSMRFMPRRLAAAVAWLTMR